MTTLLSKLAGIDNPARPADCIAADIVRLVNAAIRSGPWRDNPNLPAYTSVLNYGLPPLAVTGQSTLDLNEWAAAVQRSLAHFEPRLVPQSLEVEARLEELGVPGSPHGSRWPVFRIRAELRDGGAPFLLNLGMDCVNGQAFAAPAR